MGEMIDKAKAAANQTVGNTKQAIGNATNNPELHAEGMAQERKGEAQKIVGDVKGALGDKV